MKIDKMRCVILCSVDQMSPQRHSRLLLFIVLVNLVLLFYWPTFSKEVFALIIALHRAAVGGGTGAEIPKRSLDSSSTVYNKFTTTAAVSGERTRQH